MPSSSQASSGPPSISLVQRALGVALCVFTLAEVNYPRLQPQSQLAIFALLGLALCFLRFPMHKRLQGGFWRLLDYVWVFSTVLVCGYVVVQTEPAFEALWLGGQSLGNRAGAEQPLDLVLGALGLLLVLEAARRAVGWALPTLCLIFLIYGSIGPNLPDWLFPHRGYGAERLVSQGFLHSQGVFGTALYVMFAYVFLFVVFGALLEVTGATAYVLDLTRRLFRGTTAGAAKVSVLSSGLMGSLSGSAVANTATTGTFTIPMMRSAGFPRHVAAGVEAAASSGGALVPPVMGAGAYMMLEIVSPPVTYLQIVRAAMLPALLYYFSLFLIVHFQGRRLAELGLLSEEEPARAGETTGGHDAGKEIRDGKSAIWRLEGLVFFGSLTSLILLLLAGFTVFRSVSLAMLVTVVLAAFSPRTRLSLKALLEALTKAARNGVALVAAAASVGVVLGVVTLTGIGSRLPATLLPLAQESLFLALLLLMVSSLILGMGLPSAVCYLLLATLVGPALADLGVAPLAAHLFIFYFGLMSMVTPPVALAAYAASSIAESPIVRTAVAAFRFALVGFALPFVFVYRPELLLLAPEGQELRAVAVVLAVVLAALGTLALAAAVAGYLRRPASLPQRMVLGLAAVLLFLPGRAEGLPVSAWNGAGLAVLIMILLWQQNAGKAADRPTESGG